jgi:hypothetical protein
VDAFFLRGAKKRATRAQRSTPDRPSRMLLNELLELQAKIGIQLICSEEVQAIQELWND